MIWHLCLQVICLVTFQSRKLPFGSVLPKKRNREFGMFSVLNKCRLKCYMYLQWDAKINTIVMGNAAALGE
jgi:hypothetical protein